MRYKLLFWLWILAWLPGAQAAETPVILVFGDSLSAGFGLPAHSAWPRLLQDELTRRHTPWRVINASVSGETSAGGLTRLPATLRNHRPRLVILELGANDGLRGLPLADMEKNLAAMIRLCRAQGAQVHLVGMRLPPNYGVEYTGKFAAVYQKLARELRPGFSPFFLAPLSGRRDYFQADGIHPTADAQPLLLQQLLKELKLPTTR